MIRVAMPMGAIHSLMRQSRYRERSFSGELILHCGEVHGQRRCWDEGSYTRYTSRMEGAWVISEQVSAHLWETGLKQQAHKAMEQLEGAELEASSTSLLHRFLSCRAAFNDLSINPRIHPPR